MVLSPLRIIRVLRDRYFSAGFDLAMEYLFESISDNRQNVRVYRSKWDHEDFLMAGEVHHKITL